MQRKIDIQVRDILKSGADIIVFSAHPSLLAGSGVSGIVHKAAGSLKTHTQKFAVVSASGHPPKIYWSYMLLLVVYLVLASASSADQ